MVKVVPLYDRKDNLLDYALIDDDQLERTEKYKWRRERYARKDGTFRDYAYAYIDKIRTRLHHFVAGKASKDENVIDHIDHDGLNCMDLNLREVTGKQNAQNAKKPFKSMSGYIGVIKEHDYSPYWVAKCGGMRLGQYETKQDAAIAHDQAAVILYGIHALTNGMQLEASPKRIMSCRENRELPKGVCLNTVIKKRPYTAQCNGRYLGAFETVGEASRAYLDAKFNDEHVKLVAIQKRSITRTSEGIASIKIYRKNDTDIDILVDDERWHDLMRYRWYMSGSYAASTIDGCLVKMHNYLLKASWVDHFNRDRNDNRTANLRKASRSDNSQNVTTNNRFQGVAQSTALRWEASLTCNGIQHYIGSFRTAEAAALAYNRKALQLFPLPKLNDVDENEVDPTDTGIKVRSGKSRYRGVSPAGRRWYAVYNVDKHMHKSTHWMSEEEAALAYNFLHVKYGNHKNIRLNDISIFDAHHARIAALDRFFFNGGYPLGSRPSGNRFVSRIVKNKKEISLGGFESASDACNAYRNKWMELNFDEYDRHLEGFSLEDMIGDAGING